MSKLWILIVREYAQVVKKKSFLVGIVLTPVFMIIMTVVPSMLAMKKSAATEKISIIDIDGQGIGEQFMEGLKRYKLEDSTPAYSVQNIYNIGNEDTVGLRQLRGTLDSLILNKALKSYLVFYKNVERNDSVIMVAKSFGFNTISRFEKRISDILAGLRLQQSNIELSTDSVLAMTRRIDLKEQAPGGKERDFMTIYMGGIVFVMIIFMTIIGYGQILMRSVIEEKSSRIIEVMISSVSPFQLMAGKIIGLGLASMTQVGIWLIIGLGIYAYRGNLNISADISGIIFNPVFITYFIIYLVIGYILYSTLFALIGSICNTDKEAQNYIFPITMSLIMPIIIGMYVIQEPDSTLVTVLSLIPFFTPTMMILRLNVMGVESFAFTNPIILEATLGVIITTLTTLLVIWLTSRIFRIGILMYGKRPTLPEIYKWIKY